MEVLERGKKASKYTAKCPECESVIAFNDTDIKRPLLMPDYVKCPVCKCEIRRVFWHRGD